MIISGKSTSEIKALQRGFIFHHLLPIDRRPSSVFQNREDNLLHILFWNMCAMACIYLISNDMYNRTITSERCIKEETSTFSITTYLHRVCIKKIYFTFIINRNAYSGYVIYVDEDIVITFSDTGFN